MTKESVVLSADNPGVVARPPLIYGGALVAALVLRWLWPMPLCSPGALLWPGLGLAVLGVLIASWGRKTMQAGGTNVDPARPSTTIVTSGPFRFSRNPLYLAVTLLYLGITLALNTWWGVILLVPVIILMHRGVVLREERYLERKFGDTYRQYRSKVRRYL